VAGREDEKVEKVEHKESDSEDTIMGAKKTDATIVLFSIIKLLILFSFSVINFNNLFFENTPNKTFVGYVNFLSTL